MAGSVAIEPVCLHWESFPLPHQEQETCPRVRVGCMHCESPLSNVALIIGHHATLLHCQPPQTHLSTHKRTHARTHTTHTRTRTNALLSPSLSPRHKLRALGIFGFEHVALITYDHTILLNCLAHL